MFVLGAESNEQNLRGVVSMSDLDRLLEMYLNYINWVPNGELPKEYHQLYDKITNDEKLANELRRTHKFYLESKNGECAGVTNQILELSNYGGKP